MNYLSLDPNLPIRPFYRRYKSGTFNNFKFLKNINLDRFLGTKKHNSQDHSNQL